MNDRRTPRREFLALAGCGIATASFAQSKSGAANRRPICVFTKPFNSLTYDELAERIAAGP